MKNDLSEKDLVIPKKQRIGERLVVLDKNSFVYDIYNNQSEIRERFRHRYSFNMKYKDLVTKNGIKFAGSNYEKGIETHEILEYSKNKFFVAVQFHPEFNSKIFKPHLLFNRFLSACL